MRSKGKAYAPGAVGVFHAYACGIGGALAIDRGTTVTVTVEETTRGDGSLLVDSTHSTAQGYQLIAEAVRQTLAQARIRERYKVWVKAECDLPVGCGLKSSSSCANAVVLAIAGALGIVLDEHQVMLIARDAERKAGLSKFGAVDDGWTSLLGGLVVADTEGMAVISREELAPELAVIIAAMPLSMRNLASGDRESLESMKGPFSSFYSNSIKTGDVLSAWTISGYLHALHFNYPGDLIRRAMDNGAVAAGLSGKGPCFAALVHSQTIGKVYEAWSEFGFPLIQAQIDNQGARLVKAENICHATQQTSTMR